MVVCVREGTSAQAEDPPVAQLEERQIGFIDLFKFRDGQRTSSQKAKRMFGLLSTPRLFRGDMWLTWPSKSYAWTVINKARTGGEGAKLDQRTP